MKIVTRVSCLVFVVISSLVLCADDREKAAGQLARINAMSTDVNGRRVVSRLISDRFRVSHQDVLAVRRQFNLNYGSTFLFFHMVTSGMDRQRLTAEVTSGKKLSQVAGDSQVHWNKVVSSAKDFNKSVRKRLYEYFTHETELRARDTAENYMPIMDVVPADSEGFGDEDLEEAKEVFQQQRLRASALDPDDRRIDRMNENQVRHSHDPVRDGFSKMTAGR